MVTRGTNYFKLREYSEYMVLADLKSQKYYQLVPKVNFVSKDFINHWQWVEYSDLNTLISALQTQVNTIQISVTALEDLLPLPTDTTKQYAYKPSTGWIEITGGGASDIIDLTNSSATETTVTDSWFFQLWVTATTWKNVSGTNIKAWLKSYFDTVYQAIGTYLQSGDNVSELTNDAGYITAETDPLSVHIDQTTPQTITNGIPLSDQSYTAFTDPQQFIIKDVLDQRQKGGGGFIAPVYFRTDASDVAGYKKISYTAEALETELTINVKASDGTKLARTYLYDDAIGITVIDAGIWRAIYRAKVSNATGVTNIVFEAFLRHTDTTETTLFIVDSQELNNTSYATLDNPSTQPIHSCVTTDRFGVRISVKTTHPTDITVSTIVGGVNASYFSTPIPLRHELLRGREQANSHPDSAISLNKTYTGNLSGATTQEDVNDVVDVLPVNYLIWQKVLMNK